MTEEMKLNQETSKRSIDEDTSDSINKKFKYDIDITAECGICKQRLRLSRMLPCCHFYCFICFMTYSRNSRNYNGRDIRCPVCHRPCNIPFGGVGELPSGRFIVKLADFYKLKDTRTEKCCNPCLGIGRNKTAIGHCVECEEDLCKSCFQRHGVMKATKDHETVEKTKSERKELPKNDAKFCIEHPGNIAAQFYCKDCKDTACTVCRMDLHKEHNCPDIKEVAAGLSQVLDDEYEVLKSYMQDKEKALETVKEFRDNFFDKTEKIRSKIQTKYEDMKLRLAKQFKLLNNNLDIWEMRPDDEFHDLEEAICQDINAIQRFEVYWTEVKKCGSAYDIIEAARSLEDAASHLKKDHAVQLDSTSLVTGAEHCQISYTPCLSDLDAGENVLGTLKRVIDRTEVTIKDGTTPVFDTFTSSGDEDAGEPLEIEIDTDEKED